MCLIDEKLLHLSPDEEVTGFQVMVSVDEEVFESRYARLKSKDWKSEFRKNAETLYSLHNWYDAEYHAASRAEYLTLIEGEVMVRDSNDKIVMTPPGFHAYKYLITAMDACPPKGDQRWCVVRVTLKEVVAEGMAWHGACWRGKKRRIDKIERRAF